MNHKGEVREKVPVVLSAGGKHAELILANGEKVDLYEGMEMKFRERGSNIQVKGNVVCYEEKKDSVTIDEYNMIRTPLGGEYSLTLSDGTKVWLNAMSELRYPVAFSGDLREVELRGEAYFEVAKNAQIPFVVTTSAGIDVKVLGTKFNVASYENDEQVTTTLAEGSVEVGDEKGSVRLKPEEQALFCKGDRSLRVQKVDVGMYLAWKDGKFIFEEQSLEQIMKQLQRWYEMSVFYTNEEVKQYTFSGDLKKYDDFDKIIRMLEEVSGIKISIKENCVVIGTK